MGVIIHSNSIDTMNLYTDVIKTTTLDNIRLDNAATMTIQAGDCTIRKNSKWKLKLEDEGGNSQTFQITDNKLSIVPKGWTLDVQSLPWEATIYDNSGKIESSNQWTTVVITGIEKATLNTVERILLRDTSHVKFIFPDTNDAWEDIIYHDLSDGMVRYYVGGKRYTHMRWDDVYSLIDGDWYNVIHYGSGMGAVTTGRWYDAGTNTSVINGQLVAGDSSYPTVEITGWYNTTFEAELEE